MARRKAGPRFDSLWDAIGDGTASDVRDLLANAGGGPEEREESGDPTPLMYAAALGRLEMVQALVDAGADVNETAEHGLGGDLPELPFLDALLDSGEVPGVVSALAYTPSPMGEAPLSPFSNLSPPAT